MRYNRDMRIDDPATRRERLLRPSLISLQRRVQTAVDTNARATPQEKADASEIVRILSTLVFNSSHGRLGRLSLRPLHSLRLSGKEITTANPADFVDAIHSALAGIPVVQEVTLDPDHRQGEHVANALLEHLRQTYGIVHIDRYSDEPRLQQHYAHYLLDEFEQSRVSPEKIATLGLHIVVEESTRPVRYSPETDTLAISQTQPFDTGVLSAILIRACEAEEL